MRSTKTYLTAFFFIFFFSLVTLHAQGRVQKLYSRSIIDGVKESTPTKKIIIQVYDYNHQPLEDSYIKITGSELEFEANENGEIVIGLPDTFKDSDVELRIYGKNHYSKMIKIPFEDFEEVYKTAKLKKIRRIGGCPSF